MFDFNNRQMVVAKLKELNERDIPKMSIEKLIEGKYGCGYLKQMYDTATPDEIKVCNEHLQNYCEPGYNEKKDIFSDETCYFHWGLAHGEIITNDNGMARTYYHYLTLSGKRNKVEIMMQYHPSVYKIEGDE